jgi:hypothetical protein
MAGKRDATSSAISVSVFGDGNAVIRLDGSIALISCACIISLTIPFTDDTVDSAASPMSPSARGRMILAGRLFGSEAAISRASRPGIPSAADNGAEGVVTNMNTAAAKPDRIILLFQTVIQYLPVSQSRV